MGLPDDVGVDEVARDIDDEVSVFPEGGQIILIGGNDGASDGCMFLSGTQMGGRVDAVEVEPVEFLNPLLLFLHGHALSRRLVDEVMVAPEHLPKIFIMRGYASLIIPMQALLLLAQSTIDS